MNNFERAFFKRYIPEGQEIKGVVHEHFLNVAGKLFVWLSFGILIPSFLYYQSERIQEMVPFFAIEGIIILTFIKIVYESFNRYNDVWIITNESVLDLDWALFKTDVSSIKFENIEGIGVEQNGLMDKIFNKGTLVIHKIGDDVFALEDAVIPYEAVNEIEKYLAERNESGEEMDRFDMIMDTLGGVVEDFLDRKGLRERYDNPEEYEEKKNPDIDDYTIDLR